MVNGCSSPELGGILYTVKNVLNIMAIIAPILLLIMGSVHLMNLVRDPEDKKRRIKLKNSVIAAAILFLIPTIVNAAMYLLNDSFTISDCWNNAQKPSYNTKYIETSDGKRKTFYTNPSEYQKGQPKPSPSSGGTGGTGTGGSPIAGTPGQTIDGTAQQVGDVVWDPNDVTKISNLTSAQLIAILNKHGGKAKNFIPYASSLITTEQKYSVNVFFLLGVQALESGWVTSKISQNCNNLGGVRESKAHPSNGCGSNSGGGFAYFNSVAEFNDYHGSILHNKYLTPGGPYYNGTSPSAVVIKYCPGCSSWPSSVVSIANSLFKHVSEVI